jgi:hypothetical protein
VTSWREKERERQARSRVSGRSGRTRYLEDELMPLMYEAAAGLHDGKSSVNFSGYGRDRGPFGKTVQKNRAMMPVSQTTSDTGQLQRTAATRGSSYIGNVGPLNDRQAQTSSDYAYRAYLSHIQDPNTQRILFDAAQATLFGDLAESVPAHVQGGLELPFDQFYLELTSPVDLPTAQEPGYPDMARAFLVMPAEVLDRKADDRDFASVGSADAGPFLVVTVFTAWHRDIDEGDWGYSDRTFRYSLKTGLAYMPGAVAAAGGSEVPERLTNRDANGNTPLFPAMNDFEEMPDRRVGWWEEAVDTYSSLLSWMLTYMMAKSVQVIAEPVSRQTRRWHERRELPLPQPWHVVRVDPEVTQRYAKLIGATGDTEQGFRYDVIGHLRYGRHKVSDEYEPSNEHTIVVVDGFKEDGTPQRWSLTIEWVPPHQRGLRHKLYIPKVSKFEGNRNIDGEMMRRYYDTTSEADEDAQ